MSRKRKARDRGGDMLMPFGIAAIAGVLAAAVVEDLRYFADGSPESFLQTWRIQPVSMFVGSLVYVAMLYMLQLLNDRERALKYVYPYVPLVLFSAANLAIRLNPVWVAVVALVCAGCSLLQVRVVRNGRSTSARL
jgi:drug/metabolite transporter (DMT)-like permease